MINYSQIQLSKKVYLANRGTILVYLNKCPLG